MKNYELLYLLLLLNYLSKTIKEGNIKKEYTTVFKRTNFKNYETYS